MNDILLWMLDLVHGVDPVLRTLLAGVGMLLETSVLVGIIGGFLLLMMLAKKLLSRAESRYMDRPGHGDANTTDD